MIRTRLARALRAIAERLEPPERVVDRAEASVVAEGYAQGRADLQLVHAARRGPSPDVLRRHPHLAPLAAPEEEQ